MAGAEIELTLKPSKGETFVVSIDPSKTVAEFKQKIAERSDIPAAEQRLIYKGKLLKDSDPLSTYNPDNGHVIHLVRGLQATSSEQRATPTPAPQTTGAGAGAAAPDAANPFAAFGAQAPGGANPFANLFGAGMGGMGGMGGGLGGMDIQTAMQMMQNPAIQQMVQQMLQNPQLMQQMFQNFQGMDPAMGQMAANPAMMQMAMQMFQGMGGAGGGTGTAGTGTGAGAGAGAGGAGAAGFPFGAFGPGAFAAQGGGFGAAPAQNARELYATQLQQMRDMGFPNDDANLTVLQQCGGNVSLAIERLLSM